MNNSNYAEAAVKPAPMYHDLLSKTVDYLKDLSHFEQVDFFNDLRKVLLEMRDERICCIRSEIEVGQRRIDEILKGQEVIAKIQ